MLLAEILLLLCLRYIWSSGAGAGSGGGGGVLAANVKYEATGNMNNKIIDILKENLQKDNDDYKDLTSKKPTSTKTSSTSSGAPSDLSRRAFVHEAKRNNLRRAPAPTEPKQSQRQDSKYPKYVNKEKVEKIAKFIEKYQGLVTRIIGNSSPGEAGGGRAQADLRAERKTGRAARTGSGALARPGQDEPPEDRAPSAGELDMSPAVGGHVHSLRMENRLCQRHVLNPQGPKYDSKGKMYLKEFRADPGIQFQVTRALRVVLPKCCNCCAKSVLGCE